MIYAKLQISSPPERPNAPNGRRRLSGRLSVLDDSIKQHAFDTVQLCFRGKIALSNWPIQISHLNSGIIASCIGEKTSLEDIITLTDIKAAGDFHPHVISCQKQSTQGYCVDFFFQLPTHASASTGTSKSLPWTTVIEGSTSVTQSTAMNDRHVVQGECEVSYWIEAQFRSRGEQVGSLHQSVRITAIYPHLQISLSHGEPITVQATPDLLTRWTMQKSPKLSVSIYEPDIAIEQDHKTGKRQISIPIAVAMDLQKLPRGDHCFDSRQSLKCLVEAKWHVKDRFSVIPVRGKDRIPVRGEVIHKTSTASTQKSSVLFRPLPLYEDNDKKRGQHKQTSYVGASELELSVPLAVSQPSLCWNHYARSYTLELSLTFHSLQGAPKYKVHSVIPVTISTQNSSTENQKDEVIVGVVETDSDGLEEDTLDEQESNTPESPRQVQRLITRTPPPAYFR